MYFIILNFENPIYTKPHLYEQILRSLVIVQMGFDCISLKYSPLFVRLLLWTGETVNVIDIRFIMKT